MITYLSLSPLVWDLGGQTSIRWALIRVISHNDSFLRNEVVFIL